MKNWNWSWNSGDFNFKHEIKKCNVTINNLRWNETRRAAAKAVSTFDCQIELLLCNIYLYIYLPYVYMLIIFHLTLIHYLFNNKHSLTYHRCHHRPNLHLIRISHSIILTLFKQRISNQALLHFSRFSFSLLLLLLVL